MKSLLLFGALFSFTSFGQIDYTVDVLRLRAKADDCDGGAITFCANAPQDPVFHIWTTDAGANENTNCWVFDNDDDAEYNLWVDIQNLQIANETNVLTSYITVDMGGFESDALIGAPACDDWSGDAVMNRQLAQQFDISMIPEGVPYFATVDIGDTYFAEIEILWTDPFAGSEKLDKKFVFRMAPNPTDGVFHLSLAEDAGQTFKVKVLDMFGRSILSQENVSSKTAIDLSGNESGAYLVYVEYEGKTKVQTLMLK